MWYCLYLYVCVYDVSTDNGNNMMDTIYLLYPCTYIYTIIHYCVFMHTYIQYVYMYVCQYVLQFHASVKMDISDNIMYILGLVLVSLVWFHYPGHHLMPCVKLACSYRHMRCLIQTLPAELPW